MNDFETLEAEGIQNKQPLNAVLARLSLGAPALFITDLFSPRVNQSGPHPCSFGSRPLTFQQGRDSEWSNGAAY